MLRVIVGGDVFGMLDGLVFSILVLGVKLGKVGSGMKRKMEMFGMMSLLVGGVGD